MLTPFANGSTTLVATRPTALVTARLITTAANGLKIKETT